MVEKISNTKEISSEYQKIENKIENRFSDIKNRFSDIDNRICRLFRITIVFIYFGSLFTVALVTPPLLLTIGSANGLGVFTLDQAIAGFGVALAATYAIVSIVGLLTLRGELKS